MNNSSRVIPIIIILLMVVIVGAYFFTKDINVTDIDEGYINTASAEEVKIVTCNPRDNYRTKDCVSNMTDIDHERESKAISIIDEQVTPKLVEPHIYVSHDRYQFIATAPGQENFYAVVDTVDDKLIEVISIAPGSRVEFSPKEMIYLAVNPENEQVVKQYVFGKEKAVTLEGSELSAPLTYNPGYSKVFYNDPHIISSSTESITLGVYDQEKEFTSTKDGYTKNYYEKVGEKVLKLR